MTDQNQKQLGKTLWNIADQLRGAMNADDFRDYMLSFFVSLVAHKKCLTQPLLQALEEGFE
jgi:type I restriction-modification system DNA methylase subunit